MKRCAVYARFSTEMQRTTSLEDQIRNCRKFAAQMGYEILDEHVYQDTALSGFGVEHRPAYQRLATQRRVVAPDSRQNRQDRQNLDGALSERRPED